MVATPEAILNGLSATMILVTGYFIAIRLFAAIHHNESKLLPWQGLFALAFGSFYLGTVVSFWTLIFTGTNFEPYSVAAIMCYTVSPLGIACAMYIGFSMIKPKLAKPMTWIFALTAIPFWTNLWFNIPDTASTIANVGTGIGGTFDKTADLIDIELLSWSNFFTAFYIISMLVILGIGFIYLATHSTGEIRSRATNYAIGLILFSACGILDSRGIFTGIGILFVRIAMVVAYLFLYKAMVPPKAAFPPTKSN